MKKGIWGNHSDAIKCQDFNILENTISNILANNSSPYAMSNLISSLSHPNHRKMLFGMFLKNESLQENMLQSSYQHDNGFEKWVLIDNPSYKLRLHIYEDSQAMPQENRHNHAWDFASSIIEGCLQNSIYAIDDVNGNERLNHYQYSPASADAYGTKFIGSRLLRKMTDVQMTAGTAYFMPAEVIHKISYEQTFKQRTITLMITGNRKSYHCDLFSEHEFASEKNSMTRFSKSKMIERLNELKKL
ncbi:hypothetical protein [Lacihabitans lacunae]|uniref:Uncharacterized protein n=1 Tax=Lacihabitans lacunae TaxID=1028214 RepID=A0ABV7YS43_9BACT